MRAWFRQVGLIDMMNASGLPLISVVIPLFHKREYIQRTISTVMSQSLRDFEVIIVDDGSTDDSADLAKKTIGGDSRFRLVSQPNAGVSVARNNGAMLANAPLISFLDADDVWETDFLCKMWAIHERYPRALLYSCAYRINRNGASEEIRFGINSTEAVNFPYFSLAVTHRAAICSSAVMVDSKTFFRIGGFTPHMSAGEDIMLWIKFMAEGDYVFLNEYLATYDSTDSLSLTKRASREKFNDLDNFITFIEEFGNPKVEIPAEYVKKFKEIRLQELAQGGHFSRAIKSYLDDISIYPWKGIYYLLRGFKRSALSAW